MQSRTDQIRGFIHERIRKIAAANRQPVPELHDDLNLVETGLFDSLAFVHLVSGIEKEFNIELDTGDLGPEEFTLLGNLVRAAAESPTVASESDKK